MENLGAPPQRVVRPLPPCPGRRHHATMVPGMRCSLELKVEAVSHELDLLWVEAVG